MLIPEEHRNFLRYLQAQIDDCGLRAAKAFLRSNYLMAEYWICMEYCYNKIFHEFCRVFRHTIRPQHSVFRAWLHEAKRAFGAAHPEIPSNFEQSTNDSGTS